VFVPLQGLLKNRQMLGPDSAIMSLQCRMFKKSASKAAADGKPEA
jgi:hypothetical protein